MSRVIIIHPGQPASVIRQGKDLLDAPDIVLRISKPALIVIFASLVIAALLAVLTLCCDKDGHLRLRSREKT